MSVGTSINPASLPLGERRVHPRKPIRSVAYVALGAGNGGIITNLSEGGMAVQAAMAVMDDALPRLTFLFGQSAIQVQTRGEIVWKSPSKTIAGVRFIDIPEETRAKIRDWVTDKDQPRPGIARRPVEPASSEISKLTSELPGSAIRIGIPDMGLKSPAAPSSAAAASSMPSAEAERGDLSETKLKRVRARLKRYLVSERERIRLRDLVSQETAALRHFLAEVEFLPDAPATNEEVMRRFQAYELQAQVLVTIMSMGCFWGETIHDSTWARIVEHIGNSSPAESRPWSNLASYPALLLLYAGGLAALAEGKYSTLKALLFEPRFAAADPEQTARKMKASLLLQDKKAADLELNLGRHTRLSVRLHSYLRDPLREFVPFEADYDELFDRLEYLLALIWTDDNPESIKFDWVPTEAPLGRFAGEAGGDERMSISRVFAGEIAERGRDLPLLRAGFFDGSLQRLQAAKKRVDRLLASDAAAGNIEIPAYLK